VPAFFATFGESGIAPAFLAFRSFIAGCGLAAIIASVVRSQVPLGVGAMKSIVLYSALFNTGLTAIDKLGRLWITHAPRRGAISSVTSLRS
jgi:hypothetical protein